MKEVTREDPKRKGKCLEEKLKISRTAKELLWVSEGKIKRFQVKKKEGG